MAGSSFRRVSYTEAIELLEGVVARGEKKFEFPVSWGIDLQVGAGAALAGGGRPARVSVRASPAARGTEAGRPAVRPARAASNPSRCPPVPRSEHERCPTQEAFQSFGLALYITDCILRPYRRASTSGT